MLAKFRHQSKITDLPELETFIGLQSAKVCGELVVKYAQKRLGKLHYALSKNHPDYAQDLIDCQAELHAQVLSDMYYILLKILDASAEKSNTKLQNILISVDENYIKTIPENYTKKSYLDPDKHFHRECKSLSQLSAETGKFLLAILPASENLLPGNATIFQGQVRLLYISFLEQFDKRSSVELLKSAISGA